MKSKRHDVGKSKSNGRYAAKLLFQFRVMVNRLPNKKRLCEERIITFSSGNGKTALREAKKRGWAAEHHYKNNEGNPVYFEFVGVLDLLRLGSECEADEVWYDITRRVCPLERKASILPLEIELSAIRNNE